MHRGIRDVVILLILMLIPCVAHAGLIKSDVAVAVVGNKPAGDGVGDIYGVAAGVSAEVDVTVMKLYRIAFTATPTYGFGTPDSGPLASNPSGSLWSIPLLATLQVPFLRSTPYVPYVGVGAGVHFVRESVSFQSGIGERSQTESESAFGWHVMAGVEQNKPARLFAELWFMKSSVGGVEDVIDGRNIGGLQVRLGYRRGI